MELIHRFSLRKSKQDKYKEINIYIQHSQTVTKDKVIQIKRKDVTWQQAAMLDNLLDRTVHTVYKERDGSLFFGPNYLTGFSTLEFWTWLYANCHGGWFSCDVNNIIICWLHNMVLITILTLLQKNGSTSWCGSHCC